MAWPFSAALICLAAKAAFTAERFEDRTYISRSSLKTHNIKAEEEPVFIV